jgi:peptide/nickel transport system substrate-binding protein
MDERGLRELIEDVRARRLSRRRFVQMMVGLGLTAPMAAQMLSASGGAQAQPKASGFTPTRRGGGGQLKVLWWQAPTLLNPHFATGTKDQNAARIS